MPTITFSRPAGDGGTLPVSHALRLLPVRVLISVTVLAGLLYNLYGLPIFRRPFATHYRIDLDVYRLGGAAFAHGIPLYGHLPKTHIGKPLPFTYPPLAGISFAPMSWMSLATAGIVMTILSIGALFVTILLTLQSLGVVTSAPDRLWGAGAVLAFGFVMEPVFSTLDYGQVNIVLMVLVAADCLLEKTPWPRGLLIGFVAAFKLTPAAFILFFLIRKDFRAAVVTVLSFIGFTAAAFLAGFTDSSTYWTQTLIDSNRIGKPAYPGNQSLTGLLARLGFDTMRAPLWVLLSVLVLIVAAIGMRKAFAGGQVSLALGVNAVAGLLVSPISWSHHWVWIVPLLLTLGVHAYRQRSAGWAAWTVLGALLFHFAPHWRLAHGRYSGLGWPLSDQIVASSYVLWGLLTIGAVAALSWSKVRNSAADTSTDESPVNAI